MTTKMEIDEAEQVTAGIIDPNREAIKREILQFKGLFRMDFPEEFLDSLPMGRMIHILQAARSQQQKHKP